MQVVTIGVELSVDARETEKAGGVLVRREDAKKALEQQGKEGARELGEVTH